MEKNNYEQKNIVVKNEVVLFWLKIDKKNA
jgi:hypothetical protein